MRESSKIVRKTLERTAWLNLALGVILFAINAVLSYRFVRETPNRELLEAKLEQTQHELEQRDRALDELKHRLAAFASGDTEAKVHELTEALAKARQELDAAKAVQDTLSERLLTSEHRLAETLMHAETRFMTVQGATADSSLLSLRTRPLVRTPHMEVSAEQIQRGTELEVTVFLDKRAQTAFERGTFGVPPEEVRDVMHFGVQLHYSTHFNVANSFQSIDMRHSDSDSSKATFRVSVGKDVTDFTDARLTAIFLHNTVPRGFVTRTWDAAGKPQPAVGKLEGECGPMEPPDLVVTVSNRGGGVYQCAISSQHLNESDPRWKADDNWRTIGNARHSFVEAFFSRLQPSATPKDRYASLRALGWEAYKRVPEVFQNAFWELSDRKLLNTILILTEEPAFPWELIIPTREDENPMPQDAPLGVRCTMGRWIVTKKSWLSPPQDLQLTSALVAAVPFDPEGVVPEADREKVEKATKLAREEAEEIVKTMHGQPIDPVTADHVEETLRAGHESLLHFICHGKGGELSLDRQADRALDLVEGLAPDSDGTAIAQKLKLTGNSVILSDEVSQKGFSEFLTRECGHRALIFLNACEVGRLEPAFAGVGGFPEAFASLQAGAVIAPLWSVTHRAAHDAALEFYRRVRAEPDKPFAEIIRDIRAKSYRAIRNGGKVEEGWEDSFAAYCFYGNPLCKQPRMIRLESLPQIPGLEESSLPAGGVRQ